MKCSILALIALSFCACSTGKRPAAPSPQYAAVTRKVEDITKTINLVQSDSKEVKSLQMQSLSLLDRLDYKTTILLK
jgi:hypothetical protein